MKRLCKRTVCASEISEFLNICWSRDEFYIDMLTTYEALTEGGLCFLEDGSCKKNVALCVCIVKEINPDSSCCQLVSAQPELDFYRIVNEFFMDEDNFGIAATAVIAPDAKIGIGVSIGEHTRVGKGVLIGANSQIGNNIYIEEGVAIGKHCIIKDNAVIGSRGYDFVFDQGHYLEKPCFGTVVLSDDVMVGYNTTIERPRFGQTNIEENVKIDDLVNIGSHCTVGGHSLLASGVVLCPGVTIGKHCTLSPNTSVRENICIGNNSVVGLGSVVISNIAQDSVCAGNPAAEI